MGKQITKILQLQYLFDSARRLKYSKDLESRMLSNCKQVKHHEAYNFPERFSITLEIPHM